MAWIPVGVWAIRSAMKRGYYLDIELENDHRKLGFQIGWNKTGRTEFLKQAASLGYIVEAALNNKEDVPRILG